MRFKTIIGKIAFPFLRFANLPYKFLARNGSQKKYQFTSDFFTHNVPVWEKALEEFKDKSGVGYLEVGVFEGRSFFWVLDNILTGQKASAVAVDTFDGYYANNFLFNLNVSGRSDAVKVCNDLSGSVLMRLVRSGACFDIIYIDGSHSAADVMFDGILAWKLLKKGGIIIFDDYASPINKHFHNVFPPELTPKPAIEAFVTLHRNEFEVIHFGQQLIARKVFERSKDKMSFFDGCDCSGGSILFGRYRYYYSYNDTCKRVLFDTYSKISVTLSDPEHLILQKLVFSRMPGESRFFASDELCQDPVFIGLKKRLGPGFAERIICSSIEEKV